MSLHRTFSIAVITSGLIAVCCGKDNLQPEIQSTSTDDRRRDRSQKGEPSTTRSPSSTATAMPEDPSVADQLDSEDLVSAGLIKQRKKEYRGAIELFERACAEGQGVACYQMGLIYRDGIGVAVSERRAQSWFQLACQKGNIAACDALGH